MSSRNYIEIFAATETKKLPGGRYFFIRTALAAIDIETEGNRGAPTRFVGVGAGSKYGPVEEENAWKFLKITSATAQIVEVIISDDGDFEVASTVTISGGVTTAEAPSTAVTDTADTVQAIATQTVVAANLARRRITIGVTAASTENVRVSQAGGAGRGIQIQPGQFVEFRTTAALTVRNNNDNGTAGNANWYAFEE